MNDQNLTRAELLEELAHLRASEELHRITLENISQAVFITDEQGHFTYICPNVLSTLGYTRQDIQRQGTIFALWGDDLFDPAALDEGEQLRDVQRTIRDQQGQERMFLIDIKRVTIQGSSFLFVCRDITAHQQTEIDLQTLIDAVQDHLFLMVPDGTLVAANHTLARRFDRSVPDLVGTNVYDLLTPNVARHCQLYADQVIESGQALAVEDQRGDRYFENRLYPVRDNQGRVTRIAVYERDITAQRNIEEELWERDKRYYHLYHDAPLAYFAVDPNGLIRNANQQACRLLRCDQPEDLIGTSVIDLYADTPHGKPQARQVFVHFTNGQQTLNEELQMVGRDGRLIWVELSVYVVKDDAGDILESFSVARDITERKQAEERLHQYRHMIASIPASVSLVSPDYVYQVVNDEYLRRTARQRDEIEGHPVAEIMGQDVFDNLIKPEFERCLAGEIVHYQEWFDFEGIGHRLIDVTYAPYRDASGHIAGILVGAHDITRLKQAQDDLRASQRFIQHIADMVPYQIYVFDLIQGHNVYINRAVEDFFGLTLADLQAQGQAYLTESVHPENRDQLAAYNVQWDQAQDGQVFATEFRFRNAAGEYRWLRSYESVFTRQPDGIPAQILGVAADITAHRQVEQALRDREEQLRAAFDTMHVAWAISRRRDGGYLEVNPGFCRLTGYTRDEIIGHSSQELGFFSPDQRRLLVDMLDKEGRLHDQELTYRTKSGEQRTILFSIGPVTLHGEDCLLATMVDITERKQAEQALRDREARFRTLVEQASDGIWVADQHLRLVEINSAGCRMLGYTYDEALQLTHDDLLSPAQRAELMPDPAQLRAAGSITMEWEFQRKDGTVFPAEVSASMLPDDRMQAIVRDITERKQAEEALRDSQRFIQHIADMVPYQIYVFDLIQGHNVYINRAVEDFFGLTLADLQAQGQAYFADCIHPEDLDKLAEFNVQWDQAQDGQVFEKEYRLRNAAGEYRWLRSYESVFTRQPDGTLAQIVGVAADITAHRQVEQALRDSEERHRLLAAHVTDMISRHAMNGDYLDITASCRALTGCKPHELIGRSAYQFVHPNDVTSVRASHDTITSKDHAFTVEFRLLHKDGSYTWVETISHVVDTGADDPYILAVTRDISARKEAERQIHLNEDRLQALLDLSQLRGLSKKAFTTHALNEMVRLTGSTIGYLHFIEPDQHTIHLYTWSDRVHDTCEVVEPDTHYPLDQAGVWADCVRLGRPVIHNDYQQLERKQGYPPGHSPVHRHMSVPVTQHGKIVTIIGVGNRQEPYTDSDARQLQLFANTMWDILQRRQTEAALHESQQRYQLLFNSMLDGYALHEIICDDDGIPVDYRFLDINPAFERLTGLGREVIGRRVLEVLPDTEPYWIETYGNVALTGEPVRFENFSREVGHKWFAVVAFQTAENQFAVIFQDVTDRKLAEDALRSSEARFRRLVNTIPYGVQESDCDGVITFSNPAHHRLQGYPESELIGKHIWDFTSTDAERDFLRDYYRQIIAEQPEPVTYYGQDHTRDGRLMETQTNWDYIRDAEGRVQGICAVISDITKRKQIEASEREQRQLATALVSTAEIITSTLNFDEVLQRILDVLSDVVPHDGANVMLIDDDHTGIRGVRVARCCDCYANHGLQPPATGVITPLAQFPHLQHMVEHQVALAIPDTSFAGWQPSIKTPAIRSYVGAPIIIEGQVSGFLNVDSTTPGFFDEYHAERLKSFATQASIAIQNAQMYQRLSSYSEDLEQAVRARTAELLEANAELERLSRVKDEFVSNVSHELKSPITSFTLRHHLLRRQPGHLADHLDVLERETARLDRTIDDLLRLSRLDQGRTEVDFGPVDLNQMTAHLVQDRALQAEQKSLTLTQVAEADLTLVRADQGLLEQVLSIMLTNAIHYTPPGGRITVRTHLTEHDAARWAGFSVADTGLGVPPDEQPYLFDRFFQGSANRQAKVSGTGLGLAIAHEIIKRHNGRIDVESTGVLGEGTTFYVWLPIGEEANGKTAAGR